jgi:Ca2+-dependent lipid-binding protein
MAEQRELEVTIISAQDLKNVSTFGKMSPYAEVWIHPSRKVATPVHTHGGTDPSWNAHLRLVCEESLIEQGSGVLHIEILNHGSLSSREIGLVSVPLSQVIPRDDNNSSQAKTTSLQVCEYSCPTKGQIHCFDLAIRARAIDVILP